MGSYKPCYMDELVEDVSEAQHTINLPENHKYYGQVHPESKVANGFGIWLHANGKTLYEGQFKNGKFHGLGRIIHSGGHFEGSFKEGLKNGPGQFVLPVSTVHTGVWDNGLNTSSEKDSETTSTYSVNLTGGSSTSVV